MKRPRTKPTAPPLPTGPTFESLAQAGAVTGIPKLLLRRTKARGADGFRGARFDLYPWLRWYFSRPDGQDVSDESTDWRARKLKAQALQAELDLDVARKLVIPAQEVRRDIATGMAACFSVWDRETSLLPPKAKGLDEPAIKALMIEVGESVKRGLRVALANLSDEDEDKPAPRHASR